MISALGRLKEFEVVNVAGYGNIKYMDTDSAWVNRQGLERLYQIIPHVLDRNATAPLGFIN